MEHPLLLGVALLLALAFEFVNGFHDTANAVATVIYTRSLRPGWAVAYSGFLNFAGVMLAGVGVAFSIVHLFPVHGALGGTGIAIVFAVLLAAILWNLATWFVGIPASSSHAMIGSILGASMGYCVQQGIPLESGVPWDKARQVMLALFLSPLVGFALSAALLRFFRAVLPQRRLYNSPGETPPWWVRAVLISTCGAVSFAHGSNDGQKGMGLIMLILMGLAPLYYTPGTESVALWVKVAVALALGIGTLVGWKRVVVTVGEKIGKSHLSYAQGAAAELVAAATISLADAFKLPVSTTHVLSSGVAGTMVAQRSGVQARTLWHIGLAWVLTLPVCITLGFGLYLSLHRLTAGL